jgi:hypothetical protein
MLGISRLYRDRRALLAIEIFGGRSFDIAA